MKMKMITNSIVVLIQEKEEAEAGVSDTKNNNRHENVCFMKKPLNTLI